MLLSRCLCPHKFHVSLLFFILSGILACGRVSPSLLNIVKGRAADPAQFGAVSLLKQDSSGKWYNYCSGVLAESRHVITAAHCSLHDAQPLTPPQVRVVANSQDPEGDEAKTTAVRSLTVHPDFAFAKMGRDEEQLIRPSDAHDIAVWELGEPLPGLVIPILAHENIDRDLQDQALLIIAGFGKTDSWESPFEKHFFAIAETPFVAAIDLTVSRVVKENGVTHKRPIRLQFPGRSESEFFAGGPGHPDTCNGDSGGPVFIRSSDNSLRLLGITSRGARTCDQGGVYTLLPAYASWLESVGVTRPAK